MDAIVPRRALATARRRIGFSRVLVVNGPRQAGKSVLLRLLHDDLGGDLFSFDDAGPLKAARTDPAGFVRSTHRPAFIDEVQRAGDPFVLAVKSAVDHDDRAGQFVLAGSTRFLFEPRLTESLAGRALFVDLWPFSQGEIERTADEDFPSRAFEGVDALLEQGGVAESRDATFERVCRGGMPRAVGLSARDRREFLGAYARSLASRDAPEVGRVPDSVNMLRWMRLLAARTATEHNLAEVARSADVSPEVAGRMLGILERVYVHHRVPAWSGNLTKKAVHRPKLHLSDAGLAAALLGVDVAALRRPTATVAGQLLETFVAGELARQLTWSETEASLFHWRDRDGAEVDLVLERPTGEVVGIEVKAAVDLDAGATRGLRTLRDRLGDRFVAGLVLHCADRPLRLEDRIASLPIGALWASGGTA